MEPTYECICRKLCNHGFILKTKKNLFTKDEVMYYCYLNTDRCKLSPIPINIRTCNVLIDVTGPFNIQFCLSKNIHHRVVHIPNPFDDDEFDE